MTPEEVRGIRADAIPTSDARRLHDDAASLLHIPHLELSGHDYSVQLCFRNAKLTQVTIVTNGSP